MQTRSRANKKPREEKKAASKKTSHKAKTSHKRTKSSKKSEKKHNIPFEISQLQERIEHRASHILKLKKEIDLLTGELEALEQAQRTSNFDAHSEDLFKLASKLACIPLSSKCTNPVNIVEMVQKYGTNVDSARAILRYMIDQLLPIAKKYAKSKQGAKMTEASKRKYLIQHLQANESELLRGKDILVIPQSYAYDIFVKLL